MRTASGVITLCFLTALAAFSQTVGACPGGRVLGGFQLGVVASAKDDALPLDVINNLVPGDTLRYAPGQVWRGSARVAVLLVPDADNADPGLIVFTQPADKAAEWKIPEHVGAVAFLFGPEGFNAKKTRSLLAAHPELVAHFTQYATQAADVEALIALLSRYEQSPPGSLDLNLLLKNYSAEYGVKIPTVNDSLPPDQEAAAMLAAIAPPTAKNDPSSRAALTSGSTDTATALASLYFGPEVGIADDTLPLVRALHQSLFPGTEFQGAFAQGSSKRMSLCIADTAAPPQNHPVYIWMVNIPGGEPPVVKLAKGATATIPANWKSTVQVTCASVAQLHQLLRARQWALVSATGAVPIPVEIGVSDLNDTVSLDLRNVKLSPGVYRLSARWDWTPVVVQGAFTVRAISSLASAKLASGTEDRLVTGAGVVPVDLSGADFSFVDKVELVAANQAAAAKPVLFTPPGGGATQLAVRLDTGKLSPGSYELRLVQVNGGTQDLPVAILPPDPALDKLPLQANLGEASQNLTLHGAHLERILRMVSPDATWKLAPASASTSGLTERAATVILSRQAAKDQEMPVSMFVAGRQAPLVVDDALRVLGPRPKITGLTQSLATGGTVALLPGELPADVTVNFTFVIGDGSSDPAVRLGCRQPDAERQPVTLHPGVPAGPQELDAGGTGLFYLATLPGQVGAPGCRLQLTVADPVGGDSDPYDLGRVVRLPQIQRFTLSDQSAGPELYAGELAGENLQLIAKTGWTAELGVPVAGIPLRGSGASPAQTLAIVMPWPPPSPHAPLYIWLRGESTGRKTTITP